MKRKRKQRLGKERAAKLNGLKRQKAKILRRRTELEAEHQTKLTALTCAENALDDRLRAVESTEVGGTAPNPTHPTPPRPIPPARPIPPETRPMP